MCFLPKEEVLLLHYFLAYKINNNLCFVWYFVRKLFVLAGLMDIGQDLVELMIYHAWTGSGKEILSEMIFLSLYFMWKEMTFLYSVPLSYRVTNEKI